MAPPSPLGWLIFDAESVTDVDATGLGTIAEFADVLARDDIELIVARMKPHVHTRLMPEGLSERIGEDRFPTVRTGVAACVTPDLPPQTRSQP